MCRYLRRLLDNEGLRKINLILTYALVFTFPFPLVISLKILALWILSSLLLLDLQDIKNLRHKFFLIFALLYYLMFVLGMFHTQNIEAGLRQLGIKVYFLIFPILLPSLVKFYKYYFDKILSWFVIGQVMALVLLIFIAFYNSIGIENGHFIFDPRVYSLSLKESIVQGYNYFFYIYFSRFMHPSYAALQIVFAIGVLIFLKRNPYNLSYKNISKRLIENKFFYPLIIFLIIGVFLMGSRTNLIGLSVVLFFIVISSTLRPIILRIFLSLVVLGISIITIFYSPRVKKLIETMHYGNYKKISRIYFWQSAYEIGKEHFIFGVGTGDLQWHLYRKYAKLDLVRYLEPSFNSHNEYLEHFARLGILGMFFLLALLGYAFYTAIVDNRLLLFIFILIIMINFIFEVMLNRAMGTVFIVFFLCFLLFLDFQNLKIKD